MYPCWGRALIGGSLSSLGHLRLSEQTELSPNENINCRIYVNDNIVLDVFGGVKI